MSISNNFFILECPNCKGHLKQYRPSSSEPLFTWVYSDGYLIHYGGNDFKMISRCEECSAYFWTEDAKIIATYPWEDEPEFLELEEKSRNAKKVSYPEFGDYIKMLENSVIRNKEDEVFIRSKILWFFNDRLRFIEQKKLFQKEEDEIIWNSNNKRLYEIIEETTDAQIMIKADLCRTFGQYDECVKLINTLRDEKNFWVKRFYFEECAKGNKEVFDLTDRYEKKDSANDPPKKKTSQTRIEQLKSWVSKNFSKK